MRTEPTRPFCPKAHGYLEMRSVEEGHYVDGGIEVLSIWVCPKCGHHETRPATEADETKQLCDFCSQPNPVKVYACEDFAYQIVGFGPGKVALSVPQFSSGEWLACAECARFIDADDQPGLTARSMTLLSPPSPDPSTFEAVSGSLGQMHRLFFRNRIK